MRIDALVIVAQSAVEGSHCDHRSGLDSPGLPPLHHIDGSSDGVSRTPQQRRGKATQMVRLCAAIDAPARRSHW